MDVSALLEKELFALTSKEVRMLRRVADDVFEPLIRPFRQKRTEDRFDFRKTTRTAMRLGEFLPSYTPFIREHRKSTLVIAMSLSGVDRCAAVSLIPLFSELKKHLDFRLFIYTDDIVEAKFSHDGFLENDIDIAWNNVAAPVVFRRLSEMSFSSQEETLLVIDSIGGGDSRWFWDWDASKRYEVQAEQGNYLLDPETKGGFFTKMRKDLAGSFDLDKLPRLPAPWKKVVERNCVQRWVATPAMQDYLVRWLFHPEFGRVKHGTYPVKGYTTLYATDAIQGLKQHFKTVHWLQPTHNSDRYPTSTLLDLDVVDYFHQANTIDGFATVLANIVHGRSTNKLTREAIRFSDAIDDPYDSLVAGEGDIEHSELVEGHESCFKKAVTPKFTLPEETTWREPYRKRGDTDMSFKHHPFNEVDVSDYFPTDGYNGGTIGRMTAEFDIRPSMSKFSLMEQAENVLEDIKKYKIVSTTKGTWATIDRIPRKVGGLVEGSRANMKLHNTEYDLGDMVQDYLSLWSEDYAPFYDRCPITNVIWCGKGVYYDQYLGFTVGRSSPETWKKTVFHEAGHHMEQIVPQVGTFTNHLIRRKTGGLDKKKLVDVYGGKAMPVTDRSIPWIIPYAGKWYGKPHPQLPVSSEIISVHGEYFRSPEELVKLMAHDPFMVSFMAFVFMGGPLAAFNAMQEVKRQIALSEIRQKNLRDANGGYIPTGNPPGRPAGSGWGSGRTSRRGSGGRSKSEKKGSFGV